MSRRTEVIEHWIEQGVDKLQYGNPVLCRWLPPAQAQLLIKAGADVNVRHMGNKTPIHWQADVETIKLLVEAGADINACGDDGRTMLHLCWEARIISQVIKLGADVNARDKKGQTPLHYQEDYSAWCALLEAGANPNVRNVDGKTPLDFLIARPHPNCQVALFEQHGAKRGKDLVGQLTKPARALRRAV